MILLLVIGWVFGAYITSYVLYITGEIRFNDPEDFLFFIVLLIAWPIVLTAVIMFWGAYKLSVFKLIQSSYKMLDKIFKRKND